MPAQCLRTINVADQAALSTALTNALPGDCIVLADGSYAGFAIAKSGTAEDPIVIRSANPGGAVITSGIIRFNKTSFVTIQGLKITTPGSSQTVDGESYRLAVWFDASFSCRLTNCALKLAGQFSGTHWVMLGGNGNHNRVDHNEFGPNAITGHYVWPRGQRSIAGVTPPSDRTSWANGNGPVNPNIPLNTRIDHNYFHDQASGASEVIVLGGLGVTGDYQDYHTIVEENLFVNCNGDAEIISIKSSGNTIRHNTVRRSKGMIVSRAGNNNIIHGNFILGEAVVGTGGIRIYEKDHLVYNNYVEVDDFPLIIGGGDPYNGTFSHAQVFGAKVAHNMLISRIAPVTINYNHASHPLPPVDIQVANNIIQVAQGKNVNIEAPATNALYSLNIISVTGTAMAGVAGTGWLVQNPLLIRQGELLKLSAASPAVDASTGLYPLDVDVEGQSRPSVRDIGADEFSTGPIVFKPLTPGDVGPGTDESATPPAAPTALAATAASSDQINLSWTDNSNNEDLFRLERSSDAGATWTSLATVGAGNNSYSDKGLLATTTYYYRMRAENSVGQSNYTVVVSATTLVQSTENVCMEAERGMIVMPIFELVADASASKQQAIKVAAGFNSQTAPPESGHAVYTFDVEGGLYKVWARVSAPTSGDDSFWVKMDWGNWIRWNEIARSTGWLWDEVHNSDSANAVMTFNLSPGTHRFTIAYREDGIRLDQLLITNNLSFVPSGTGPCAMLPPSAPSALTSTVISSGQINLSWTDNSNNERIFYTERSGDGGVTWADPRYLGTNSTTIAYGDLTPLSTYHFRVRAENDDGVSAYSNITSGTTPAKLPVPKSPSDVKVTEVTENSITISWNDNSDDETNFMIWRTGPDIRDIVAMPAANTTTFTDTGLRSGYAYYYSVFAENANGPSDFYEEVKAITLCTCLPPVSGLTQAEELKKSGFENYTLQGVNGVRALSTATGSIRGRFLHELNPTALVDVTIRYFDESDGQSSLRVYVGGALKGSRTMNADDNNWKTWLLHGVTAGETGEIRIESARAGGEEAFIDYIDVRGTVAFGFMSFQAEDGSPTAPFNTLVSRNAGQLQFISVTSGTNSNTSAPATGRATYLFSIPSSGVYKVWGRIFAPTSGSDSFWAKMDNGSWIKWNGLQSSTDWIWDDIHNSDGGNAVMNYNLSAGNHTLTIAYREIGTQLDELIVTSFLDYDPNEVVDGDNLKVSSVAPEQTLPSRLSMETYPNPSSGMTTIMLELKDEGRVKVVLLNTMQQDMITLKDEHLPAGKHAVTFDAGKLNKGIYAIRMVQHGKVITSKLLIR